MKNTPTAGQPSKLTDKFLKIAGEVITDENALYLTDEDLIFLINEKLDEEERICDATFENWKAGKVKDDTMGEKFLGLIKNALINQKRNLHTAMQKDPQWQRKAWTLERKFKEWRLPTNVRLGGDAENPTPLSWRVVNYAGATTPVPLPATELSAPTL